jgi:hypothetical protein
MQSHGVLHLVSCVLGGWFVLSVSFGTHFALTRWSAKFFVLLYAMIGFSRKTLLCLLFSIRCQCLLMILLRLGLAGLKVSIRGILLFLSVDTFLLSLKRSSLLRFLAFSRALFRISKGYPLLM